MVCSRVELATRQENEQNERKVRQLQDLCEGLDDHTALELLRDSGWALRGAVEAFHDSHSQSQSQSQMTTSYGARAA